MIVANDLSKYYFGEDYSEVYIITREDIKKVEGSKKKISMEIVNKVKELIQWQKRKIQD